MSKIIRRITILMRSAVLLLIYKSLPGVFFQHIGWGTRIYGAITFGTVGNANISVGKGCSIHRNVFLAAGKTAKIVIDESVSINTGTHIVAVYGIVIEDHTMISEYVTIRDQNHAFKDCQLTIREQGFTGSPVKIGRDVWIGRGSCICAGVTIGDGCIIGANSVVNKSLPPYSVAVGVPARVIRRRGEH